MSGLFLSLRIFGHFTTKVLDISDIEQKEIVGYNLKFDISFLEALGSRMNQDLTITKCKDIMDMARRKIKGLGDYKLKTVADYFSCDISVMHRALQDCMLIHKVYEELNKM